MLPAENKKKISLGNPQKLKFKKAEILKSYHSKMTDIQNRSKHIQFRHECLVKNLDILESWLQIRVEIEHESGSEP